MITKSDTDVQKVLSFFAKQGVDVAFLVPTETGFRKSIMDATGHVRSFLRRNNIHDYSVQGKGQTNKISIETFFVEEQKLIESVASLYRPETKNGDPRIWFKGLKKYCSPNNLLALVIDEGSIYVFNMSLEKIRTSIGLLLGEQTGVSMYEHVDQATLYERETSGNLLFLRDRSGLGIGHDIIQKITHETNQIAEELLAKLRGICKMGYVPSVTAGDTGVGMTLENLLGIHPNSSKNPDYKGIEIKAARQIKQRQNRVNLFSQIPDWSKSPLSAIQLLDTFGYEIDGRQQLYCTIMANKPNPQSLYFSVDDDFDALYGMGSIDNSAKKLVHWDFETLRKRLDSKHKETFWVKAKSMVGSGVETFHYEKIVHTKKPNSALFPTLVDSGIITMDFTLSKQNNRVRDHGYLFKIKPNNISMLFPEPVTYDLKK